MVTPFLLLLFLPVVLVCGHIIPRTATVASTPFASPTVNLGYATYQGTNSGSSVNAFLGMRFAAPPLDDLRFRAPQRPVNVTGIQSASEWGAICVGVGQDLSSSIAEDCLFVNVFMPANATVDSKLPVWLYIQGGGYADNSNANYNGTEVIEQSGGNIVFVNFNYRVGIFGFLASQDVVDDGDLNVGLLDQRMVMKWVHEHIAQFGGDPNHVVIHGTSAGAGSVSYHLTAYGARNDNLFAGAIAQSPFWPTSPSLSEMEFQYQRVLNATNCSMAVTPLSCLRSLDTTSLLSSDISAAFPGTTGATEWYWVPIVDGDFIRNRRYPLFEGGNILGVPLIVSNDNNEGSLFAANASTSAEMSAFFVDNYPKLNDWQLDEIVDAYPLMAALPKHNAWFPSTSAAYGDALFTCPGDLMAASMAESFSTNQVWNYHCNITSPTTIANGEGTPHTFEMAAILGTELGASIDSSYYTTNADIIPVTMNYYISFVRALDPNVYRHKTAPLWSPWGGASAAPQRLLLQTNATHMERVPQEQTNLCSLWKTLSVTMEV